MELRHLKYFIAVAEELHFGRAAKRLNISQPPLSQQIKQFEEELNLTLFNRTNRSVSLTEAGEAFYKRAVSILNDIEISTEYVQSIARGVIGTLRIGFSGSVAFDILPRIVKTCTKEFPNITLDLAQLTTAEQVKALKNRKIDLGFLVAPVGSELIQTKLLRTENLVLCLPENHPVATQKGPVSILDLKDEQFIMSPEKSGPGYYAAIQSVFKDAGFTPKVSHIANEQVTFVSFVASGLGVSIVPSSTKAIKIQGVVYKELDRFYPKSNYYAWNTKYKRPVLKKILKLLHNKIAPCFFNNLNK